MSEVTNNAVAEKKLTKKDLRKVFFLWETVTEVCLSYERLMSLGFCHSMTPVINRLYTSKEDRAAALKRHLVFFNTENNWGAFIPGLVCSMEEDMANGKPITPEMINNVKIGLMGPLAGIGDTITQGLIKVILLAVLVNSTIQGNYAGPVIFAVLYATYILGVGAFMFNKGYYVGKSVLAKITDKTVVHKITDCLSLLGMTIAGAMIFTNVSISTPFVLTINGSEIIINEILEQILPNLLGATATLSVFACLKKGIKVSKIIIGIFIVGFLLSLIGIL